MGALPLCWVLKQQPRWEEPLNLWCWSGRGKMECGKRVMGVSYKSVIRQT